MPNAMARRRVPERMDAPDIPEAEHRAALRGLGRLNRLSGGAAAIWPMVRGLRPSQGTSLRALDVATGAGDVAVDLTRRARAAGVTIDWTLCDISSRAAGLAAQRVRAAGSAAEACVADVLTRSLPRGFDIVTCSLFLHHLDPADAVRALEEMAASARRILVVTDLRRSRVGLAVAAAAARAVTRSPVVHHDAPASVRAAYAEAELVELAERASLAGATVDRVWPQRLRLIWMPQA